MEEGHLSVELALYLPAAIVLACQAPTSGEDIAGLIGDRSDPGFEREFLHDVDDHEDGNDGTDAAGSANVDALFKTF